MTAPRRPAVLLLSRDLRVADHPALAAAGHDALVLFVLDDRLVASPTTGPNRLAFLLEALEDLRGSLRAVGGELYLRRGDPASVALAAARAVGAGEIHVSADVTATARRREARLAALCADAGVRLVRHAGVGVVPPTALRPQGGGDHYRVFTPYWRAWSSATRRRLFHAPAALGTPGADRGLEPGHIPSLAELTAGADPTARREHAALHLASPSPRRDPGGEHAAWARLSRWAGVAAYAERSDMLATDGTARVAAHLHFGCISPAVLEAWALGQRSGVDQLDEAPCPPGDGASSFVRQLCWRDFYLAVTSAFPAISRENYRPRAVAWRDDPAELDAWKAGTTGVDLVDAAMRQLLEEGFVHNRARLVASSYLVKTLRHHWRAGAEHYLYWLSDADVASNYGNWQWMAGTGNDTRPNRVLSPERQAKRYDPDGAYRARYLGERAPAQGRLA